VAGAGGEEESTDGGEQLLARREERGPGRGDESGGHSADGWMSASTSAAPCLPLSCISSHI